MSETSPRKPDHVIVPLASMNVNAKSFALSGRVADAWAMVEFNIDRMIWDLAAINEGHGACITAQMMGVYGRFRALRALIQLNGGSDALIEELSTLQGKSNDIAEERNRIVHDPWMLNLTNGSVGKMRITAKNKLHFAFVAVTDEQVESLLSKIASFTERLLRFEEQLSIEYRALVARSSRPLPEEPPPKSHP